MAGKNGNFSADNEPMASIINTLDTLESTLSNLELDVRNELNAQRLLQHCQLNLASKCQDAPINQNASAETWNRRSSTGSTRGGGECNCRCNQALVIYVDQLRQAKYEQEELLQRLKTREEQTQMYRFKLMESNAIVEHQKQEMRDFKENEKLVTQKIKVALEEENRTLMDEINRLKRLPDELREQQCALKQANKELQDTKCTLKSLMQDIESGLETCENISGELQQERKRAFRTLNEIDDEKRKVMTWVAKYTDLKQQYDSALAQKQSVDELSAALAEKTFMVEKLTKEYDALKEESVGLMSSVEARNEKQRKELQERVLELECENLRLKIALEDQSYKTSDASHNMHRELLQLEQKFNEAQDEIAAMKRYNEAAAAAAEYGKRQKSLEEDASSVDMLNLSPPFCSRCAVDDTSASKPAAVEDVGTLETSANDVVDTKSDKDNIGEVDIAESLTGASTKS